MYSIIFSLLQIIYIDEGHLRNLVILDPAWLGRDILGPVFSPGDSLRLQPSVKSVTGRISLADMERMFGEWDSLSVARIFEHFEMCSCNSDEAVYEFPCLMRTEPLYGMWVKDPNFVLYAGLYLECSDTIFSPGLFPRVQVLARKNFGQEPSEESDEQELTLWSNGIKFSQSEVEVLVEMKEPNRRISIVVRGRKDWGLKCHSTLQQFYNFIMDTVLAYNPGTCTTTRLLSPKQLAEHARNPVCYSVVQVFDAERGGGGRVRDEVSGVEESIEDVICCGCEELLITARSAPYTRWKDVSLLSRARVCRMLDPAHPFGKDWCLLALQLGLTEEVASIDQSTDGLSPTHKLLSSWDTLESSTVASLVDALRGIGRDDVVEVVLNGISPFSNPNHSVVISLPCVTLTSYVC